MKPIIFLDIHGVLTNATSKFVYGDKDKLDPVSVRLVEKLADECDAIIVLTSSITHHLRDRELLAKLVDIGARRLIPYLGGVVKNTLGSARGVDVARFMQAFDTDTRYVIIDDKRELFDGTQPLVIIDPEVGFKLRYYEVAAERLCSSTT